jgi:L-alanine-DL-glutamate epimerase-like enolase superfamily enzyme
MTGRISKIDAFEVTLPLPKPLHLGAAVIPHREYSFVRVYDGEGHMGTGFALSRNAPVALTALKTIVPFWEGQPLDQYDVFYERTARANSPQGTNGIFWRALSLADCALFDLLAQRAGQPLAEYLGGKLHPTPTMLVGGYPLPDETPESLGEQMQRMAAYQPAGIKIGSSSDYARDTHRLAACRVAIPAGAPLMIDLYWNAKDADSLLPEAPKWAEFNMGWIEDPFQFDDFDNVAQLADHLSYPVAVGDEQSGVRHFRKLMDIGRIGVLRLDATVCGGIRAFLKIAELAAERNLWVSCHVYHHVHSQLASVIPNARWLEYFLPESGLDSIQLIWNADLVWSDGALVPTGRSGMGYDWNEDALRHYRKA